MNVNMNLQEGIKEYFIFIRDCQIKFKCKYNPESDEVVLFLHGLACSSDSFRNLNDKDYFPDKSLLVIDLVGFGKSSKPENFSYSMEEQAGIIEELLSDFPQWQIHIAAHSMSGAIVLLFKPETNSRIISFANIEGNLISGDCGVLSRGIVSNSFDDYKNNFYEKHIEEFKGHTQLRFEETTPLAVYKSAVSLVQWSDSGTLLEKFRELNCKKSYFYGEENIGMPVLNKLDFVEKIMIHNSGHGMMTDNPDEFYFTLAEFINSR